MTRQLTSNINHLGINENFPIAGQDNDTQTFRDNFDTIKSSLRSAKEDIEDLLQNTARLDDDNNFGLKKIENALFQNNRELLNPLGNRPLPDATTNVVEIDYQNGNYQTLRATSNIVLQFTNFPGDPALGVQPDSVGRLTLEIYSDGTNRTITFTTSSGTVIKKAPDFPGTLQATSASNPLFVEVWRHRADEIFVKYIGVYS